MKLSLLLSSAIFAASIIAAPLAEVQATSTLQSHPLLPDTEVSPDAAGVQYSSNWAGAVLTAPPAGSTFNAVSGTFTIPKATTPNGQGGSFSGAAWVGIDGDTYGKAILQAGIQWTVTNSGGGLSYQVSAWHEWYPAPSFNFGALAVHVGDVINISITSSSNRQGTVVIHNQSTGQSVSKTISAPNSNAVLGGKNAEWIVEDYSQGGALVPFSNFGTVTFTGASCKASNGQTLSPAGSTIIDLRQNGQVLTSASTSGNTVTVTYK